MQKEIYRYIIIYFTTIDKRKKCLSLFPALRIEENAVRTNIRGMYISEITYTFKQETLDYKLIKDYTMF